MASGRTVGQSPLVAIVTLACLIVAGCATTQETTQQSYVWQMGRICDARSPFWRMERVEADGRYLVQGATNAPPGRNDYVACMQEQFTKTPYREWLSGNSWEANASLGGSYDSDDIQDYYQTPWDLGYGKVINFDHDFIGRAALEKLAA